MAFRGGLNLLKTCAMGFPGARILERYLSSYIPSFRSILLAVTVCFTTLTFLSYPSLPSFGPLSAVSFVTVRQAKVDFDWYTTQFLDERLPVRPHPQVRKWNILACAMVQNEVAYLAEWIEFHRLQGVDHFVLYDYRSTDSLVYFPMFYEDLGLMELLTIIPAKFVPLELRDKNGYKADRSTIKRYAMIDCYMRHRNLTEWIVMMDVNQFFLSVSHNSTWTLIEDLQQRAAKEGRHLTLIASSAVTYGPAPDISAVFDTWITPNARTGGVDLYYEPVPSSFDTFPLVTELNPFRAKHEELDSDFEPYSNPGDGSVCIPLVFVHNSRCTMNTVTDCVFNELDKEVIAILDDAIKPSVHDLIVKNYPWRPKNRNLDRDSRPVKLLDTTEVPARFSAVLDETAKNQAGIIRKRIMALKPKVFRHVGRECVPEAVKAGQQVPCPDTHPYPYGEVGVNFLRNCCVRDEDDDGAPLGSNSTSCWNGISTQCPDALHLVLVPWIHMSCCINTAASNKIGKVQL